MANSKKARKKRKLERRLDDEFFPIIGQDISRKPPKEEATIFQIEK